MDALRTAYNYFRTPQTDNGPLFHHLISANECVSETGTERDQPMNMSRAEAEKRIKLLKSQDLYWVFHPDKFLPS